MKELILRGKGARQRPRIEHAPIWRGDQTEVLQKVERPAPRFPPCASTASSTPAHSASQAGQPVRSSAHPAFVPLAFVTVSLFHHPSRDALFSNPDVHSVSKDTSFTSKRLPSSPAQPGRALAATS